MRVRLSSPAEHRAAMRGEGDPGARAGKTREKDSVIGRPGSVMPNYLGVRTLSLRTPSPRSRCERASPGMTEEL